MGRYYNGDIEGKFWFGLQSSIAGDRFGYEGHPPEGYLEYEFDEDNLEDIKKEIDSIEKSLGKYLRVFDIYYDVHGEEDPIAKGKNIEEFIKYSGLPEDVNNVMIAEYADLLLGRKILKKVKEEGACHFTAEL